MAGSYNHAVDRDTGQLRNSQHMLIATDTHGDAYETIEEMFGMIWYLASLLEVASDGEVLRSAWVAGARANYRAGLALSPGRESEDLHYDDEED